MKFCSAYSTWAIVLAHKELKILLAGKLCKLMPSRPNQVTDVDLDECK